MQYQRIAAEERKKNNDAKRALIVNFVSMQCNKPVSDGVCEDLKGAIAQWIASSGRHLLVRTPVQLVRLHCEQNVCCSFAGKCDVT